MFGRKSEDVATSGLVECERDYSTSVRSEVVLVKDHLDAVASVYNEIRAPRRSSSFLSSRCNSKTTDNRGQLKANESRLAQLDFDRKLGSGTMMCHH